MIAKSREYKLCEFGDDCVWRIVSEGSAARIRSAFRAAKRDCKGRKFCVAFSMRGEIGESIDLSVPTEKEG